MKFEIDKNSENIRLDVFLSDKTEYSRSQIKNFIGKNQISVNGKIKKNSYKLVEKDIVELNDENDNLFKLEAENIPLNIVYEDDYMLVINKPKNMLTHPTTYDTKGTLVNVLMYYLGENLSDIGGTLRRGIVHRLDKNTSGLLMIAKDNETHINLQEQIKTKTAIRKYLAISLGNLEEKEGTINKPIAKNLNKTVKMYIPKNNDDGLEAITNYKVLESFDGADFIELELKTGRTHQIRVHLSSIGHPIFGDTMYGAKNFKKFAKIKTTEQVLQSYYLSLKHPKTGKKLEFKLEKEQFDDDIKKVLKILRENK